jgi:hypothetical protein
LQQSEQDPHELGVIVTSLTFIHMSLMLEQQQCQEHERANYGRGQQLTIPVIGFLQTRMRGLEDRLELRLAEIQERLVVTDRKLDLLVVLVEGRGGKRSNGAARTMPR